MIDQKYLDAIKRFEGFTEKAKWDYAQASNGYGTRARFEGEVIDKHEAERRFKSEIASAFDIVQRFAPNLDDGTKAALTSLTFNAGPAWTRSGLGKAIQAGDLDTARALFTKYNRAGGSELAGLTSRRLAEATWFDQANKSSGGIAAIDPAPADRAPPSHIAPADRAPNTLRAVSEAAGISISGQVPAPQGLHPAITSASSEYDVAPGRSPLKLDSILVLLSLLADADKTQELENKQGHGTRAAASLAQMPLPLRT